MTGALAQEARRRRTGSSHICERLQAVRKSQDSSQQPDAMAASACALRINFGSNRWVTPPSHLPADTVQVQSASVAMDNFKSDARMSTPDQCMA